jgi:hypothetical protein
MTTPDTQPKPETAAPNALTCASTPDLLDELDRRSLGLLCVSLRVEEGGRDHWSYRVKGSSILLGALSAALQMKTRGVLDARAGEGDAAMDEIFTG